MESFFLRYRNLLVLLAILLAQIIGLAVQVRRTPEGRSTLDARDGPGVRLIRLWAQAVVTPPEMIIHATNTGSKGLWQNYIDLHHVREQNQDLQKTIDRLRLEQAALLEDAKQGQRLQALAGFQEKYIYQTIAAQAIGSSGNAQSHVFYIDKGSSDGLARDNAVITADGIVGKVRDVFPHTAQVLAVNDQTSGAGVILETTRIRGILRGNAGGKLMIVDLLADKRIQKGEVVLTAGGDQIFPRGLPVGVVENVIQDPERDSFIDVIVTPAAHLDRLDEVLVITSMQPRFSPEQQQDIATSETLKGAEAAAINEQKKASEIMAERLPGLIDPNLPPDQQPLHDSSNPVIVAHPPQALHPDRFTPGNATGAAPDATAVSAGDTGPATKPVSNSQPAQQKPAAKPGSPQATPLAKPVQPAKPKQTAPVASKPATKQPPKDKPGGNT
jgi:rod shape-determining protein MreC